MAEIAAAIGDIRQNDPASQSLVIGAMPLCRARLLPAALARFLGENPSADISIVEGAWRDLVEPLRDGSIDLMIGALRSDPEPEGLTQTPLVEDHLVVIGRVGHPLAGEGTPSLDALARFPWVIGPARSPLRHQWERLFGKTESLSAPIECGSVMTIRGLLSATDFLTLLSPAQVALEVASGVLTEIGGPLTASRRVIGYSTRASWRATSLQARFLAHLTTVALESDYQESE
jgi:DNA-binding transcriptional LysR family regulator